jgi:sec-independent protein translocase protein TatA
MPFRLGVPELLIILVIVILLFGVGRVTKIGGELGNAIRSFRKGLGEGENKDKDKEKKEEDTISKE